MKYMEIKYFAGPIHKNQAEKDTNREEILKIRGFKVLRIENNDLDEIENVKHKIIEFINGYCIK